MEPVKDQTSILIYSSSTVTGTLIIQFAKWSSYTVIITCSPHNFDPIKKLGTDAVYDYNDSNSIAKIYETTKNNLKLVFDTTISLEDLSWFCNNALLTEGGDYSLLLHVKLKQENVKDCFTLAYMVIGEAFNLSPNPFPAKPEDRAFAEGFLPSTEKILADKTFKVHPPKVCCLVG